MNNSIPSLHNNRTSISETQDQSIRANLSFNPPVWPKKEREESKNKTDRLWHTALTATAIPINIRGSFVGEGAWEVNHNRSLKQDTHTVALSAPHLLFLLLYTASSATAERFSN